MALLLPFLLGGALLAVFQRARRSPGKPGTSLVLAGNLALLLLLVSLVVLAGEFYYRFIYDTTDSLMYTKASRRWVERYYVMNTASVRDNIDYKFFVERGKRRITFLGDSFTAGHGIKSVEERFANIVRRAHPEWEVHVAAKMGLDTGDEADLLNYWLTNRYEVDIVALVYCLNDISDLMPERRLAVDRINDQVRNSGWLQSSSYLFNIIGHRMQAARDPFVRGYFDMVQEAYRGPLWDTQKSRLKKIQELTETHGGKFVVITFPFLHALGGRYAYEGVHEQLDAFWRSNSVPHLDLLPVLLQQDVRKVTVNRYDAHPNEFASGLVAPVIARFLEAQIGASTRPKNATSGAQPREATGEH